MDVSARTDEALAPLLREPERVAVLCDLDGTLAPIVARSEAVAIAEATRIALARCAERCAMVAIVSGRRAVDARRIVGLEKITYAGNHGLEILRPNSPGPTPLVDLGEAAHAASAFVDALEFGRLADPALRREDKGPIVALHWRDAADESLAENVAAAIAAEAEESGLATHRGRKVLELRPDIPFDKGRAVASLLDSNDASIALYAGDDRTDLDAFAELSRRRERGMLSAVARVGVASADGPTAIVERADLVVAGTDGVLSVLRALSD